MSKLHIHSAIGKGRPVCFATCSRTLYASQIHTSPLCFQEGNDKKRTDGEYAKQSVTKQSTKLSLGAANGSLSRADRLKAATNDVQSLFERSGGNFTSSMTDGPPKKGFQDRVFKFDHGTQTSGRQARDQQPDRSTASASLKERLRQRAAQREAVTPAQSQLPLSANNQRSASRTTTRPGQLSQDQRDRRTGTISGPGRRARNAARSSTEARQGSQFVRETYVDPSPDAKNIALLEKVLLKQKERRESNEAKPKDSSELSQEEREFEDLMKTRAVKPDVEKVIEMPKGMHNETLGSGLNPAENVERLMAMAAERSKGQWAGLQVGEEADVDTLAAKVKAESSEDLDESGKAAAHASANVVLDKWVGGRYQTPQPDTGNIQNSVLQSVIANKSYTSKDAEAIMSQFKKIVDRATVQPTGKVGAAIRAGAREATMKGAESAPRTSA